MEFRQSRLATVFLLVPVVCMALLALADLGIGDLAAVLAPGAAYAPTFWGMVLLVESGMLLVTVFALPAPRLLLSRDALTYSRPLRPEVMVRWNEIRTWGVIGKGDKQGTRIRLDVLGGAPGRWPFAALTRRATKAAALTLDTRGWTLVRPSPPDGVRIHLGEVLLDCLARPELQVRLPEVALEARTAGPARVVGKRAALFAVALAAALQLSTVAATTSVLYSPQSLLAQYGRAAALFLVLAGLACWIAGTNDTNGTVRAELPDAPSRPAQWRALAIACFLLGGLIRLGCTLLWNRAGLLAMYFDLRGIWLLLAVTIPLAPALLARGGRAWLADVLAERRHEVELLLWFGLALVLVVGPLYQDYLNQLYGNRVWALMSIRDAVFLPYAPLCVAALSAFSAGMPRTAQRILLVGQALAGLAIIAIAELFAIGYTQIMADINTWMSNPPSLLDEYTTRQLVLAFGGGLIIEGLALSELVSLSPTRALPLLLSDVRWIAGRGRAALSSLAARRIAILDAHTLVTLFFSRWRIYSVFTALLVFVTLAPHLSQPPAGSACCRASALAVRPPTKAQAGAVWVRPIDGMRMRYVPATTFMMGLPQNAVAEQQALCQVEYGPDSAACDSSAYAISQPQHQVRLAGYWIDETAVTNAQFARFVAATRYVTDAERNGWGWVWVRPGGDTRLPGASWLHPLGPDSTIAGHGTYPVVQVSWHDAEAYATWAGMALPTEAQWELAAHGLSFQPYPWGSAPMDGTRANDCDAACPRYLTGKGSDGYAYTSPVGHYPAGASPYGVLDMAGDVLQWTSTLYGPYPGTTYHDPLYGAGYYVERGGSYAMLPAAVYTTNRGAASADTRMEYVGFRCASPVTATA